MAQLSEFLLAHGWMLACGVSALLVCGALVAALVRSVVLRQRVCELCVLGALVWLVLASVPMPRVGWTVEAGGAEPLIRVERSAPVRIVEIPPEIIAKPQAAMAVAAPRSLEIADPVEVNKAIDWRDLSARGFLAGALICVGWLMLGRIVLWRMVRGSVVAPERVGRMVEALSRRNMGGTPMPPVWVTPGLSRPVTCGVWRPAILLPEALLAAECRGQLRQVLLHELGHVHQGDGWGNLLFCLALPVLYWHPAYWWLRRCAGLSRELVADDWAARADGKEAYVTELVALARMRMAGSVGGLVGAIGILQSRSDFYRRMHMLLQRQSSLATGCSRTCRAAMGMMTLAVVMGMVAMVGVRPAKAQTEPPAAGEPAGAPGEPAGAPAAGDPPARGAGLPPTEPAATPGVGGAPAADPAAELWKMMQKEIIIVDGRPVNLEAVTAKYRELLKKQNLDAAAQLGAQMRALQAQRSELNAQIAQLRAQGLAEEHPDMRLLRERQAQTDAEIERYAVEARDLQTKMADGARRFGGQRLPAPVREIPPAAGGGGDGMRGMRAGAAGMVGGVQLDLVNLANTLVDAAGAVRVAKVNVAARKKLAEANGFTNVELATEEANLETAAKRLELLKGIAAIALEGASAEFERTNQRYQTGMEGQRDVLEAQSKMKMLQLIVKSAE